MSHSSTSFRTIIALSYLEGGSSTRHAVNRRISTHRTKTCHPLSRPQTPEEEPRTARPPPPSRRRLHARMLIRQPKHDLPIGTGHHIVPGVPLHTADLAAEGQTRHGLQHLVRIGRGVGVPDQGVLVRARRADHVPPVGAEAHVALAGDGAAGGVRG